MTFTLTCDNCGNSRKLGEGEDGTITMEVVEYIGSDEVDIEIQCLNCVSSTAQLN